jgi:AcrR family transcriptional regulator
LTFCVPFGTLQGVENNRAKILECALTLFTSRGYEGVGVQEVADAAGLKKPTLYHYFGSKNGLLKTLLTENFEELFQALEKAADYQRDVLLTLNAVVGAYFDFAQKHPAFYRMQLSMWFAPPDSDPFKLIAGFNERQQEILEKMFLAASKDHGNMKGRHRAYAATFLGMLNTYIALSLNGYAKLNDHLTRQLIHQYMHGIFS